MKFPIPAAMHIESATDMPLDDASAADALKELETAVGEGYSSEYRAGYLRGLGVGLVMVITGGWNQAGLIAGAQAEQSPLASQTTPEPGLPEGAPIVDVPKAD